MVIVWDVIGSHEEIDFAAWGELFATAIGQGAEDRFDISCGIDLDWNKSAESNKVSHKSRVGFVIDIVMRIKLHDRALLHDTNRVSD